MSVPSLDRILLIGFMGSGKSSVGRRLAERLGWRFVDFDSAVESEAGLTVPEIFASRGEAAFRELEERVARRLLRERQVVLASGGGWAAAPGRLESVPEGTEIFWLRVSPTQAVQRAGRRPGSRPLLDTANPLEEASRLLAARAPYYGGARWTVDTEHASVEDVSAGILDILAREYPELATR